MARRGFRKIDNDTFKALMAASMSGAAFRIVLAVIDRTLGFQEAEAKIPLSHFQKVTGLSRQSVQLAVKQAEAKNLITAQRDSTRPTIYALNDYRGWLTGQQNHPSELGNRITPDWATESPQTRQPASFGTTMPKETIKETIKESIVIFNHWNQQNVVVHKKLTDDIRSVIVRILRNYSAEEVKSAISNYAEIIHGEQYFFKYKWTLKDFLKRGIEKFTNLEIAKSNFLKEGNNGNNGKTKGRRLPTPKEYEPTADYPDL
ncbi:MAG TPA: replication protein [Dehalococcoidia bacterium]|nr:replication protein [Dehalococcoidia bacterium]